MAAHDKDSDADITPSTALRARYEHDVYGWSQQQARLIREGRWGEIDRDNVAEEIKSVGWKEFDRLVSALRVLMVHMLKWDHQPERRSRSWVLSIRTQRNQVGYVLSDNPGLKPRLQEAVGRAYSDARIDAAQQTELDEDVFPATCPYSFEDITSRSFSF